MKTMKPPAVMPPEPTPIAAAPAPMAAYPPIKQKAPKFNPDNATPKGAQRKGRGFK